MDERIRTVIDRKHNTSRGWYRLGVYDFSTPEKIISVISFINSNCDRPILEEYIRFLERMAEG